MSKLIPLSQGQFAIVDDADFDWLMQWKWCVRSGRLGLYYATRHINRQTFTHMHNEIMYPPSGYIVDHINGNGLDNQRANLRVATQKQNCHNRRAKTRGSSRYKGVGWHRRDRKWQARIFVDMKRIFLGSYATEKEAAEAYDAAAREHYGSFAYLNFPESE